MQVSKSDLRNFHLALQAAKLSTLQFKHGACVVSAGRILSLGVNKYGSSGMQRKLYPAYKIPTIHAELAALIEAGSCKGSILYSARIGRNGVKLISTPCPACTEAIACFGVKAVVYFDGEFIRKEKVS